MNRLISIAVLLPAILGSCTSTPQFPEEWLDSTDAVHVFGDVPEQSITLASGDTLLDLIARLEVESLDSAIIFRETPDAAPLRVHVDIGEMLESGNTVNNVMLLPGDVVHVEA